jgi:hypothetical protein
VEQLTLSQAAKRYGIPVSTLRLAALTERLRAKKLGSLWVTTDTAVEKWKIDESKHRRGPKPARRK